MNFIFSWLPTLLVFILMLGILVFVHELGHFVAARLSGMKVKEFAFGFPPRIWGRKFRGTLYVINWIPLGGYVKILGEDESSDDKHAFGNRPIRYRIFVLVAGVAMNFVLAYVIVLIMFWCSFPMPTGNSEKFGGTQIKGSGATTIESIEKGTLAEKYDFKVGDKVLKINTVENPGFEKFREEIGKSKGAVAKIEVQRGDQILTKDIEIGDSAILGVGLWEEIGRYQYTWWKVPYYALLGAGSMIWITTVAILNFFKDLIIVQKVTVDVMGPVGIFGITSVAIKLGFYYVLGLMLSLTISLGIINILPFPALDGGRVVFALIEKIRGKKAKENLENIVHSIGFFLLIALAILITVRDVMKLW